MIAKRFVLHFPRELADQPIMYRLAREYDLEFNILLARITPAEKGLMVAELRGEDDQYNAGLKYLYDRGVNIQPLSQDVSRDESRCNQCGACVTMCPTGALAIPDRSSMEVVFNVERCIACSLCVNACPPTAMHITLNGSEDLKHTIKL